MPKTAVIIISALLILSSCTGKREDKGKSAAEVVNEYKGTLIQSPRRAREAAKAVEQKERAEEKAIKELDEGGAQDRR